MSEDLTVTYSGLSADEPHPPPERPIMTNNQHGQAPDSIRVPLDSLHADAEYLLARLLAGTLTREQVVGVIRDRIDAARLEIDGLRTRVQELGAMLRENRSKRIVELEAQLEAIGAGGVEPLRKRPRQIEHDHFRDATKMVIAQSAPAAVAGPVAYRVLRKRHDGEWVTDGRAWCDGVPTQDLVDDIALRSDGWRIEYAFAAPAAQAAPAAVAGPSEFPHEQMDAMALARYKVVPSTSSMFWRHAVVAGDGAQQLYVGREVECQNMARKFAGAFLDGAFAFHSIAADPTAHAAPVAQRDAWLEAAIAWEVCASIHRQWAKGKDAFYSTRQSDFQKHAEDARARAKEGGA